VKVECPHSYYFELRIPMTSSITFLFLLLTTIVTGFSPPHTSAKREFKLQAMSSTLFEPAQRDATYGSNVAKYLVDLHDSESTFDFCGGMLFQLMLSDKLYNELKQVADNEAGDDRINQPVVYDMDKVRMNQIPNYNQNAIADNVNVFHGRELRNIPHAKGGFGFVLQLSHSETDPEGWSSEEVQSYDGWKHDVSRQWRKADDYEAEGFEAFKDKFGENAYGLNHRFYLHYDRQGRMWLSAEDGCEGTPSAGRNPVQRLLGL